MRDTALLQLALSLTAPWTVSRSDFDPEARRLDIEIDFARSRFVCPTCGAANCPAYDTERMTWRHLNFFQHQAYLNARVPRVRCDKCGVKTVNVPWARPDSGFTLLFEALVMTMVSAMPVKAVARIVGEHDTRLWRVIHHYVDEARARTDASGVTRLAIDETAARRGQDYVTLFVDIDQARVVFATEGNDAATIVAFADDLAAHGGDPDAISQALHRYEPQPSSRASPRTCRMQRSPSTSSMRSRSSTMRSMTIGRPQHRTEGANSAAWHALSLAAQSADAVRSPAHDAWWSAHATPQDRPCVSDPPRLSGPLRPAIGAGGSELSEEMVLLGHP